MLIKNKTTQYSLNIAIFTIVYTMLQNFLCMFMNKSFEQKKHMLTKEEKALLVQGYEGYQHSRFTAEKYTLMVLVTFAALFINTRVWEVIKTPASQMPYVLKYPTSDKERKEQKRMWIDGAVALAQQVHGEEDMKIADFLQRHVYTATMYKDDTNGIQIQPIEEVQGPLSMAFLSVNGDDVLIPFYDIQYIAPMRAILVRERLNTSTFWKSMVLLKEGKKILHRAAYGVDHYEEVILEEYVFHIVQSVFPEQYLGYVQKVAEGFRFQVYHNSQGQEGVQIDFHRNTDIEEQVKTLLSAEVTNEYLASFIKHAAIYAVEKQLPTASKSMKNHAKKTAFTQIDQLLL